MTKKTFVVGLCGGTCSGKSTLSINLEKILGAKYAVSVFHMDKYYKREVPVKTIAPVTGLEYPEFNHPDALKTDLLYRDFDECVSDAANDIVIIEGLFAFHLERVREKLDLKVFVDLRSDERLYRRIRRSIEHSTLDNIAIRYLDTVRYRHDELVEPTRWHADLVINGTLDTNRGTDILVGYIEAQVNSLARRLNPPS